jgi:hypothetical protein
MNYGYREEFLNEEGFTLLAGREGKSPVKVRLIEDPDPPQAAAAATAAEGSAVAPVSPATPVDATVSTASAPQPQPDRLILCKSDGRRQKEWAIHSAAETKYLAALTKLTQRVASGKLQDRDKVQRALGRVQQRHPRVQRFYQVSLAEEPRQLTWKRRDQVYQADEQLLGCHVLRTDQTQRTAQEFWSLYVTWSQAEDGFHMLKSDLGLRPNHHQGEEPVQGHIFITVRAYYLLWWVLQTLAMAGESRCWQTLKRVLQTHAYATVFVSTKSGIRYRVRKAGEPELGQKAIYEKLNIEWKKLPWINTMIDPENKVPATL